MHRKIALVLHFVQVLQLDCREDLGRAACLDLFLHGFAPWQEPDEEPKTPRRQSKETE